MHKLFWIILVFSIVISISSSAQQQIRPELVNIKREGELIDAHLMMLQNKWSEAAELLNRLKVENPTNAVFNYELAKVHIELEQSEKAVENMEKAVALEPENIWYREYAAFVYNSLQRTSKELKMMLALTKLEPGELKHYQKAAGCYVILGNFEKAIEVLEKYEQLNDPSVASIQERFFIHQEAQDWENAEATLKEWVNIAPSSIPALESLAALQHDMGRFNQATKNYERILEIHPNHLEAQQYLFKMGGRDSENKSLEWYSHVSIGVDQKIGKILAYLQSSNAPSLKELQNMAKAVAQAHPKELKAQTLLADLFYLDEQYGKALEGYYATLKEEKYKKPIYDNALECAYKTGNDQYLYEIGNEMLIYFPAMLSGYYYTALGALRKAAWNECKQLLNEAALISKYDAEMQQKLAFLNALMIFGSDGDLSGALSILEPFKGHPDTSPYTNYLKARAGDAPELPKRGDVSSWQAYDQMAALIYAFNNKSWGEIEVLSNNMQLPPQHLSEKYFWLMRSYQAMSNTDQENFYRNKLREMNSFYIKA